LEIAFDGALGKGQRAKAKTAFVGPSKAFRLPQVFFLLTSSL
jgi:hypothetical protein